MKPTILTKSQKKTYGPKLYTENGTQYKITVTVRHDDECGNGHNSFAITASIYRKNNRGGWEDDRFGCCHDDVAKHFPELAPFIKYHLMDTDSPMHYTANPIYLAGERDHWGLLKGEKRQIRHGGKEPCWKVHFRHKRTGEVKEHLHDIPTNYHGETCPEMEWEMIWDAWCHVGEGKKRELDAARASAVWPEATDEELTTPGLETRLKARLPKLMEEFQQAVESLGFTY